MNIPDRAVEAAAAASYEQVRPLMGFPSGFDEAPEPLQETYRGIVRAALEAAAPYMRAHSTLVDQTVELAEIIRGMDGALAQAEAVIAAGYRKAPK